MLHNPAPPCRIAERVRTLSHLHTLPVFVIVPSGYVGSEEFHQYGSNRRRSDLMRLTF